MDSNFGNGKAISKIQQLELNMCIAASASHAHLCSPLTHFGSANPAASQSKVGKNTGCSQTLLKQPAKLMVISLGKLRSENMANGLTGRAMHGGQLPC